jgi:hypothetical protein
MIDDRLGADIQPLGHLIEVKRAKREELKYAPSIFVSQDI